MFEAEADRQKLTLLSRSLFLAQMLPTPASDVPIQMLPCVALPRLSLGELSSSLGCCQSGGRQLTLYHPYSKTKVLKAGACVDSCGDGFDVYSEQMDLYSPRRQDDGRRLSSPLTAESGTKACIPCPSNAATCNLSGALTWCVITFCLSLGCLILHLEEEGEAE